MAINNTASILQNNAAMFQGANSRIFDAITQASEAYEARRRSRDAAIEAERQRQADIKAAEQAIALDPEKAIMREAMARGVDPNSVTPEMRAAAAAGKDFLGSKVLADQFGRPYKPYNFGAADMMAPVVQAENLPLANATADMMAPLPAPTFTSPSGGLLPPPAALKVGETRMEMPSPVGEPDVKRSAIASVRPPKMIQGAAGPIPDPVDQKRYEAELAVATESDKGGAKTEAEKRASDFGKGKLQKTIDEMIRINEELGKRGGLQKEKQGVISNIVDLGRNIAIPIPFSANNLEIGKGAERVVDPKTAKLKQDYEKARALGFQLYKNAAGIAAGSLNSDAEQAMALSVFGDTGGFYESNKVALEKLKEQYGTGGGEKPSGLDTTDPRVKKALEAGYTEEQVKAFLNGK